MNTCTSNKKLISYRDYICHRKFNIIYYMIGLIQLILKQNNTKESSIFFSLTTIHKTHQNFDEELEVDPQRDDDASPMSH